MLAALTMLVIDRNFGGSFFDSGQGGSPLLYAHLAWIFFTGMYAVVLIAAFGIAAEVIPTFSRQPLFSHGAVSASLAAIGVLGVLAWMQNMYSAPIGIGFLYFAMLMALALIVPVGIVLFNLISTIRGGAVAMRAPMRFAVGSLVLIVVGLAGEWAQSVIPVGWQVAHTGAAWGDTQFALIGGGVLGGFAGLYYWFPKITGRYMGEALAGASFWLIGVGSFVMIWPIQLAGIEGMPVDVYKYFGDSGMTAYNVIGSIGAIVVVVGVILTMINTAASYGGGAPAGPDAWQGNTLEWFTLSPPPSHNFDLVPDVRSNEPLRDIREAIRRRATHLDLPPARPADSGSDSETETGATAATTGAEPDAISGGGDRGPLA